ncbi:DUF4190 domain-containing protein [Streptococcus orisasini]
MKKEERKVLPILALVFGGIGLALSWVPFINNLAFLFAVVGLILGIVAFIVNLKKKKVLTIIGTIISFVGIVIVLVSQSAYSDAVDKASKEISTTASSEKIEKSSDSKTESKSTSSLKNYDPNLVSDEKIQSMKTYGDYLDIYKLVVDDYIGYYNYKLEQLNLTNSDYQEEFKKAKAELDQEYKDAKEEYGSMKNMPLSGSEEFLAQALIQIRNTYRQTVDTMFASIQ